MPRATPKPTIEEIDTTIAAIRARAEKEIAALEQRKTRVQASHFQRITRVAKAAGCDLAQIKDADLIVALKALNVPFQGQAAHPDGAPVCTNESDKTETAHDQRRGAKG